MTIFSRLSDIINSNLNALLERAEDPAKLIRLVIQEMEDTLVEVRSAAVAAIAERKELERRATLLGNDAAEWQRKAEFALGRDREDLARGALLAKEQLAASLAEAQTHLSHLNEALARQNEDIGKLQAKLNAARAREKILVTRKTSAAARLKMRAQIHGGRTEHAFSQFETIERKIDEMEGRVEAYDLGRTPPADAKSLTDAFAELEAGQSVEAELQRLKSRLQSKDKQPTEKDA